MSKSKFKYVTTYLVLTSGLLISTAQPAHAQLAVHDVVGDVIQAATQAMQKLQSGFSAAVNAMGQTLQVKAASTIADSAAANNRQNIDVATAQKLAIDNTLPTSYSACAHVQSALAQKNLATMSRAVGQAMANSGSSRQATASSNSKDIKEQMSNGLVPCSNTNDPQHSVNTALNCQAKWGGKYEKADRTMEALFSGFEFPVPDNYTPPQNGVYDQLPVISQEKYMPFAAAYSYCQHITPPLPPPPQAIAGKVTVDAAGINAYADMEAKVSEAYGECMSILSERMQYGTEVKPIFADLHTHQATICQADVVTGYLDGMGTCTSMGRSQLQQMADTANRDSATSYQAVYLQGADRHDILAENRQLAQDKRDFASYIAAERAQLSTAISAAASSEKVYSSSLSRAVTTP